MNAVLPTFPPSKGRGREMANGWKEIALAVGRSVRTVQRWERTLQLPVRSLGEGLHVPVFAFKEELQLWLLKTAAIRDQSQQPARTLAPELLASIEKLFKAQTISKNQQHCPRCGSDMQKFGGLFWLDGTNKKWEMSLPFCPTCEPELLQPSPERIH